MIVGPIITPACTGADGSGAATVTHSKKTTGFVYGIYVSYVGDDPATTDVTVSTLGTYPSCPSYNLLVATDLATDKLYLPRMDSVLATTGVAQSALDCIVPVDDFIVVTVAQANTGDIIRVWLFML